MHTRLTLPRSAFLSLLALALGALPVPTARAQLTAAAESSAVRTGSIDGTLLPPVASRKSIAEVKVAILQTGQETTVDRNGGYHFSAVVPGTYTLVASGDGFSRLRITDVVVQPNHSLTLSPEAMPMLMKDGEVQMMEEVIVSAKKDVETLEKYVVTDQKPQAFSDANVDIPRTINDSQPYYIFSGASVASSGAVTVEDYLKQRLTMDTTAAENNQKNIFNANFTQRSNSTIALNGLTAQQTLILVNGRRLANVLQGTVDYQGDLNGIPIDSIDRIEVLPASASGIYGGGALGGVINIVTKNDYSGGSVRLTYDNPFNSDAPTRTAEMTESFAFEGGKTHLTLAARYSDSVPLLLQDRPILESYFTTAALNYPPTATSAGFLINSFSFTGALTRLYSTTPLAGTNSNFTSIPAGYRGFALDGIAPLLVNAGNYAAAISFPPTANPINGRYSALSGYTRVKSFNASLRRQMTAKLEVFVDASYASDGGWNYYLPLTGSLVAVPATAPTNPFKQPVTVYSPINDNQIQGSMNYTRNLDAGFRLKLPHDWSVEGDYTWNQSVSTAIFYNYDFTAWSAALASGALDLFKDTLAYPPNVDPYYYWATQFDPATLNDVAFRSSGPIGSLPGGAPTLSMSFEKRKEGNGGAYSYSPTKAPADVSATYFIGQVETATSTYAEFEIPVIGGKNALPGVKLLDLQIAGRLEWFGVKTTKVAGSTSTTSYAFITGGAPNPTPLNTVHAQAKYNSGNPTFGARYKPFDDLMFRASYATAFLPPTYGQLIPGLQSLTTTNVVDPRRGNATTPVYTISGGNPNIHPESDKNWNGGVVFTPHALPGLRASVDFVHIVKRNDISTLSAALMVANESAFPDRVIRGPVPAGDPYGVGPITVVNITSINLYETSIDMYNMELDYRKETAGWGTFNLSALATRGMHYKQQLTLALPFYDYARFPSIGGPLAWKGNVNLTWDYGRWTVGWSARFASEYNEYVGTTSPTAVYVTELGGLRVPSQMYHDVFVTYKMPSAKAGAKWWEKALSRTDIQLGIKDVFNSVPPFDSFFQSTTYYSPVISDMRLRDFMVSVKKSF